MTSPRLRAVAALLAAAPLGACHKDEPPPYQAPVCQLPAPQPSALPTYTPATAPATPTQTEAIHFPATATGQTVTFTVPAGTESVTIVEQATSPAVPLTVSAGALQFENTPVPLTIAVGGTTIFSDVNMPPSAALHKVPPGTGVTVLDPTSDPSLAVYFFSSGAWTGALTTPNTSVALAAGVPAGTWTVTVGDWNYECSNYPLLGCTGTKTPSLYDVTAIVKPAAAPSSALAMVFHLVTTSGLTAANASQSTDLQRVEWALKYFLNQAGITANVSYPDVPAAVIAQYATGVDVTNSGVCGGLGQLLQLAGPGNQLHVFLVDLIKDTGGPAGFITVGLDPTVPGPASFGGTPASGVLVSLANLGRIRSGTTGCPVITPTSTPSLDNCGDDRTAFVVAHEAGHFLGLYHTTEGIGTIVDPIADSPACLCPNCKPTSSTLQCQGVGASDPVVTSPYLMLVSDCLTPTSVPQCGGGDNLMFWLLALGQKGLLTAGQAAVMRASPLVE